MSDQFYLSKNGLDSCSNLGHSLTGTKFVLRMHCTVTINVSCRHLIWRIGSHWEWKKLPFCLSVVLFVSKYKQLAPFSYTAIFLYTILKPSNREKCCVRRWFLIGVVVSCLMPSDIQQVDQNHQNKRLFVANNEDCDYSRLKMYSTFSLLRCSCYSHVLITNWQMYCDAKVSNVRKIEIST